MKVIICGSRDFVNYELLKRVCDYLLQDQTDIEIVSGCCRGADKLGERYADEKGHKLHLFPANWNEHKLSAGHIRNEIMAKFSEACIAFRLNKSSGTTDMISLAKKYKLKLSVKDY